MGTPPRKPRVRPKHEAPPAPPWERQANEPEDAWLAFVCYRDMARPRSLKGVALGNILAPYLKVTDWYSVHGWQLRVVAYDNHIDSIIRSEREEILAQTATDVAAEHMAILTSARSLVRDEFAKMVRMAADNDRPGSVMNAQTAARLLDSVVKLDRLVRDQTTENVSTTHDLTRLSDEELALYEKLLDKAKG